jgi:imidazolonepropionase
VSATLELADFLLYNAGQLLTCDHNAPGPKRGQALGDVGLVGGGAVAARGGRLVAVGPEAEVLRAVELSPGAVTIDAGGNTVLPGLVDCHTHAIYAGDRAAEFALKLAGVSYLDILKQGGGINTTVRHSRQAGDAELAAQTAGRLKTMLAHGTTTVEVKSGYGLTTAEELRQLKIVAELAAELPLDIVPTFMGAHAVPPEYKDRSEAYVDLVVAEMLPAVAAQGLARFCDVFCEAGVFSVAQSERILRQAAALGLGLKIHAEEMQETGGALLAGRLGAVTAEHLLYVSPAGIGALAAGGTIAVLLPGTSFYLRERYAPARDLIAAGVPVALATDANPGSNPCENLQLVLNIACLYLRLTPEEAINAVTLNAAHALGLTATVGSLAVGKQADLVVLACDDYRYLAYHYGINLVRQVIKKGRPV